MNNSRPNRLTRQTPSLEYGVRMTRNSEVGYAATVIHRSLQTKYGQAQATTTSYQPEAVTYQQPQTIALPEQVAATATPTADYQTAVAPRELSEQERRLAEARRAIGEARGEATVPDTAEELTSGAVIQLNQEGDNHEFNLPA